MGTYKREHDLEFDVVIIGGGVIGLAIAYHLSLLPQGQFPLRVLLLEKHERFGTESSARNSEVIHAGIYYPENSLKEFFCIEGKEKLYSFCRKFEVPYRQCGKWIVGFAESENQVNENQILEQLLKNASRNGVPLHPLSRAQMKRLEPEVEADYGLDSPTSGIIDSESLIRRLVFLAQEKGALLLSRADVISWQKTAHDYEIKITQGSEPSFKVYAKQVVNAAGWSSLKMAAPIFSGHLPFDLKFVRGHYFSLSGQSQHMASRLIYPIPDTRHGGLGIHLTLDLGGGARLGPDTDWRFADHVDFQFYDEEVSELRNKFFQAAKKYLPRIRIEDLTPGFVGVRAKRVDFEANMLDFYVQEESARGYAGWCNLIGIESPGLTSSFAIAEFVAQKLGLS